MEGIIAAHVSGSIMICFILLLRKLFVFHFVGSAWAIFWKILTLRLLCPFTIRLPGIEHFFITEKKNSHIRDTAERIVQYENNIPNELAIMIPIIWGIGGLICMGKVVIPHIKNRKVYQMALPLENESVAIWIKRQSLRRKIYVKVSDRIITPLTYSIWKPVILLPRMDGEIDELHLEQILEHELIHIKRFDVLFKWLLAFICAVYWVNPFIWIMYSFANRDIELACDEAVLKSRSKDYKKSYILTLIYLEEKRVRGDFLCNFFSRYPMEERVQIMIRNGDKKALKNMILPAIAALLIALFSISSMAGEYDGEWSPKNERRDNRNLTATTTDIQMQLPIFQKRLPDNFGSLSGGDFDIPTIIIRKSKENYSACAVDKNGTVIYEESGTTKNVEATLEHIYNKLFQRN